MRVAIPQWKNRVSPLMDTVRTLLVIDTNNECPANRQSVELTERSLSKRASCLNDLSIELLICGGISKPFAQLIKKHGIELIPWVTGDIEEVLGAYLKGCLVDAKFMMPGCQWDYDHRHSNLEHGAGLKKIKPCNRQHIIKCKY